MRSLLIFILALATLAACNSSGCLDNGSALPLAGFYNSSTGAAIGVDSVEIQGIGAPDDSILLKAGGAVNQVYLPMRSSANSTQYVFKYRHDYLDFPEIYDTLTFDYQVVPYFASAECGAMYIYRVEKLSCTDHLIDSVKLVDSIFTNTELERIKIYFRVAQPEEGEEQ